MNNLQVYLDLSSLKNNIINYSGASDYKIMTSTVLAPYTPIRKYYEGNQITNPNTSILSYNYTTVGLDSNNVAITKTCDIYLDTNAQGDTLYILKNYLIYYIFQVQILEQDQSHYIYQDLKSPLTTNIVITKTHGMLTVYH